MNKVYPRKFCLLVDGNGMENAGIKHGEIVFLSRANSAQEGDIVFVTISKDGRVWKSLSRYRVVDGEIHLCSETNDKNFLPFVAVQPNEIQIHGKVELVG